ncbi:MAG: ParB/RepB/Spo0J family partition protein [Candidatus Saccharibacteria bacterium]|nr:ParB/RepB/Spo0J family partition protein [Candidatus Saccharibacteria bacterium]
MSAKTGLGRGFDSLIPKGLDTQNLINEGERIQNILIADISPDKNQPRSHFDETALEELADSIKRYGIVQPLIVTPIEHNKYSIVAGERRWRAAKLAGLDRVPAVIRNAAELEKLEVALIENVQRVDLSPLEQAVSIERLHQQFNMNYKDIASRLGKAATTINNIVRLLQLPEKARDALAQQKITEGHARAILALKPDTVKQQKLLELILKNGWSVRQAEQYVVGSRNSAGSQKAAVKRVSTTTPETKRIGSKLKTDVTLKHTAKGGRLEIHFKNDDDLRRIVKTLTSQ